MRLALAIVAALLIGGCCQHGTAASPFAAAAGGGTIPPLGQPALSSSHLVQYPVPTQNAEVDGFAIGPASDVWFVERGSGKIGKITQGGAITEYPIPGQDTQAGSRLIRASAAHFWFIGSLGVYRVTFSGQIKLAIPGPGNSSYNGLAMDSQGNLWSTGGTFTGENDLLFRFQPGKGYTEFTTPTPNSGTGFPVRGSDGNIWFVENGVNKVGRVTPDGTITEFALPSGSVPIDTTLGEDGNVYVTDLFSNVLHQVAPSGTVTDYGLPSPSDGIVQGPHQRLFIVVNHTRAGIRTFNIITHVVSSPLRVHGASGAWLATDQLGNVWFASQYGQSIAEYKNM